MFLTNNFTLVPFAAIYKDRWQVKLFKVIKQNLQIKTFVGLTTMA